MKLLFEQYVKENRNDFFAKVVEISNLLEINPNWLMAVMYKESGLNHRAINKNGGASGLIQFMPATAKGLGTSIEVIRSMSNIDQLDWVYRYFRPYKGRIRSYTDLYMATFFPAAIGKSVEHIIQSTGLSAATIAKWNPAIDLDKNGSITVGEFNAYCYRNFSDSVSQELKKKAQ